MSRRTSAMLSAAITLVVFTALPLYAPSVLPPEYFDMISQMGLDVVIFLNEIAVIGVVMATLALAKGFVPAHSVIYLLASIVSITMTLLFTMITVSLGRLEEIGRFGITTLEMNVEGALNIVTLDFRLFLWITFVVVALKIVQSLLKFTDARKKNKAKALLQQ